MTWQKVILYVLGGIALIILGWLLHSAFTPKPKVEIKETIKRDTIETVKTITITKTKVIEKIVEPKGISFVDSIQGNKDDVDYKIIHSISEIKELGLYNSDWQVEVKPLIKNIVEYVTKDSIRTVVNTQYLTKPFFLDHWFYIALVELAVVIVAIIF